MEFHYESMTWDERDALRLVQRALRGDKKAAEDCLSAIDKINKEMRDFRKDNMCKDAWRNGCKRKITCKECDENNLSKVRCETCGAELLVCGGHAYKVYTGRGDHIFCLGCLGRFLISAVKPEFRKDDWNEYWHLIDTQNIYRIVRTDEELGQEVTSQAE